MSDPMTRWPRLLSPMRIGPMELAQRAMIAAQR